MKNKRPKLPENLTVEEKMQMFLPEEQINDLGFETKKEVKDGVCHHKIVKKQNQ